MRTLITIAALLVGAPALAQDSNTDGFYVGFGLGDYSTGVDNIDNVDDIDTDNLDFDPDNAARKVFAGWRFNRFFAVQVDWLDFDRSQAALDALNISTESEGLAPSVVGTLPLGPIELFARAGILWYDVSVTSNNGIDVDESDRGPVYGAGIGVTVAKRLNLRLEYEVIDIDNLDDTNALWLSAAWRF